MQVDWLVYTMKLNLNLSNKKSQFVPHEHRIHHDITPLFGEPAFALTIRVNHARQHTRRIAEKNGGMC